MHNKHIICNIHIYIYIYTYVCECVCVCVCVFVCVCVWRFVKPGNITVKHKGEDHEVATFDSKRIRRSY